jgi:hypothetical protein
LRTIASERRPDYFREIDSLFSRTHEQIQSISDQLVMWDSTEQAQARRLIAEANADLASLTETYNRAKARAELLPGPRPDVSGGSASQRAGLLDQRQDIAKGTAMLGSVVEGLESIRDAGQGVREELAIQAQKERGIEGRLDVIDTETGIGNSIIGRMWRRERTKTVAIWILVIVVIIGLAVFLYFVFK